MTRTVTVDGQEIRYELERKEVRNLNLRVRPDGSVRVSANPSVSEEAVDAFVTRRGGWILNQRRKFAETAVPVPERRYVSGETFYVLGRGLRLLVTKGASDRVESDGVYLRLEVKDPNASRAIWTGGAGRFSGRYWKNFIRWFKSTARRVRFCVCGT